MILINEIKAIISSRKTSEMTGIPEQDWLSVRKLFQNSTHEVLQAIFDDARYLRLLNRGNLLSERLSENWRTKGEYGSALQIVREALTQDYFATSHRKWKGVFVMTIHKAKGKEFDEVIIWDDQFKQLVRSEPNVTHDQDRLLLRVAATRAKRKTIFLTPKAQPCVLL